MVCGGWRRLSLRTYARPGAPRGNRTTCLRVPSSALFCRSAGAPRLTEGATPMSNRRMDQVRNILLWISCVAIGEILERWVRQAIGDTWLPKGDDFYGWMFFRLLS